MLSAYLTQTGSPDVIRIGSLPDPAPGPGQVRVRVRAASVNPIDTYIRSGTVAMKLPNPFVIGCDLAGEVDQCGPGATRFKPGDRVWASNQGLLGRQGTFAEFAVVDEDWLHAVHDSVNFESAAACSLTGITAHLGLERLARLKPGESIFVRGGTGGVGSMVIQMAKAMGARVAASAGSETKAKLCAELGADLVVSYKTGNILDSVKAWAPNGVNVWWETVREPDFDMIVSSLAPRGRIILMAGRETRPPFPVGPFYVKGCSMHGFAMFTFSADEQRSCATAINQWLSEGKLKARIDRVLPLEAAAEAHRIQEDNTLRNSGVLSGKIVIRIGH